MADKLAPAIEKRFDAASLKKLAAIKNDALIAFLNKYIDLFNPDSVFVCDGSVKDADFIRAEAIKNNEEIQLPGKHTLHFENYADQGRDKGKTRFLLPKGVVLGQAIDTMDRDVGLEEILGIMKDAMKGRRAYVFFFVLGPAGSDFAQMAAQITDSSYVGHSEIILYRAGYETFKQNPGKPFFKFVHTQGELQAFKFKLGGNDIVYKVSKNMEKKRIYIDLQDETVFSANTQYAGNTVGLKKLAMRLAIQRGSREGWLTEHMFVMDVFGPKGRTSYFTGAYPSMCGKTSTAMLPGEKIVGDDIAYIRNRDGKAYAVNVEKGIFGIIEGVNAKDDTVLFKKLQDKDTEIIFSNVLLKEDMSVYWNGMDNSTPPTSGINYAGEYKAGMKGPDGVEVKPSHKNARFTIAIASLENADTAMLDNREGAPVAAYIYGGRDVDTSVPIEESFDFDHGIVFQGAFLESETTAATVGKAGVRTINPMSNIDFLSVPLGKYIKMNLDFGAGLKVKPKIYRVNYFLQDEQGKWLNERMDKAVWLKWAELRAAGEVGALKSPTGLIPKHEDLAKLFKDVLKKEYTKDAYTKQFSIRVDKQLERLARIKAYYEAEDKWIRANTADEGAYVPAVVFKILADEEKALTEAKKKHGALISPEKLA
ncbi:MAG: phosphoenolpyruvate carboxykinase (GTP) [Candidatus Lokiarchaeota archaeon]|nr:phosphoenolpyruvate carboxykinase (GTP) [Candidatus Lokiarchaeota archaeon]